MDEIMKYSAPNVLVLCVDSRKASDVLGRFYSKFDLAPTVFRSSFDLIVKMDEFYDKINFPQASLRTRRFHDGGSPGAGKRPNEVQRVVDMMEHRGDLATFVVHVQYRQNATWQGKIVWTDKKKECAFRSALEMLKLMDEAISGEPGSGSDKGEGGK